MMVSNTNVPLIAPSVNVQTEQVARENKVRSPVTPAMALDKTHAERKVKSDDKRRQGSSWQPSEHPDYDVDEHELEPEDNLTRLFSLLALHSYSEHQGKGYVIRFRLPRHILEAAIKGGMMARRRKIIHYFYGQSVSPHTPSDILAVL